MTTPTPNTPLASGYAKSLTGGPSSRSVLFIGDSSVRQLFFSVARLVDGNKGTVPKGWESDAEQHTDRKVTIRGAVAGASGGDKALDLEFWW